MALDFDYPPLELETEIVVKESGLDETRATKLVKMGQQMRTLEDSGLESPPGTRLLVHAAALIAKGLPEKICL